MASTRSVAESVTQDKRSARAWEPSRALYREVLAGLRRRHDMSMSAWCDANGIVKDRLRNALLGGSRTAESNEIMRRAMVAAGLVEAEK